jgi:hypothetical protein
MQFGLKTWALKPNVNYEATISMCINVHLLHAAFLLSLFFNPEDGDDTFLQNVSWLSMDYTVLYPGRQSSSL